MSAERYGYEARCELVVYSREEALEKPDLRSYLLVCDRMAIQPTEIVFVDDVDANTIAE